MINYCVFLNFFKSKGRVFFAGIGGISMSALAFTAKAAGLDVVGYDAARSSLTEKLEKAGVRVIDSFDKSAYEGVGLLVYTGAIHDKDPVLAYPRSLGIPEMTRAEFMGALMREKKNRIGVSGTHGKSTTTGMIGSIFLEEEGRDPTIMIGAEMTALDGTFRTGKGEDYIFEACEYQDSFLHFYPTRSVILNVEHDHADYFPTLEDVIRSFAKFADLAADGGEAIVNADNPGAVEAARRSRAPAKFFSLSKKEGVDLWCEGARAEKGFYRFRICTRAWQREVKLRVPGIHNVSNALAAALAADRSGVSPDAIAKGLEAFRGVRRRFEYRGVCGKRDVFDDYAHHPDEIRATLTMARTLGYEKVTVVFQSHTFSRTKAYWDDFVSALSLADEVIVADIYPAREDPIPGVTGEALAKALPNGSYLGSLPAIAAELKARKEKGLIIVMGAGSIVRLTDLLLTGDRA